MKKNKAEKDLLIIEYNGIVQQITHWNSHFWAKSQFFLVIQSAFLTGAISLIPKHIADQTGLTYPVIILFFLISFFNIYLCYVWFRTNRRNQQYLYLRFKRAKEIEKALGTLQLFQDHDCKCLLPKENGSAQWERHLATGFIIAWSVLLLFVIFLKTSVYLKASICLQTSAFTISHSMAFIGKLLSE